MAKYPWSAYITTHTDISQVFKKLDNNYFVTLYLFNRIILNSKTIWSLTQNDIYGAINSQRSITFTILSILVKQDSHVI